MNLVPFTLNSHSVPTLAEMEEPLPLEKVMFSNTHPINFPLPPFSILTKDAPIIHFDVSGGWNVTPLNSRTAPDLTRNKFVVGALDVLRLKIREANVICDDASRLKCGFELRVSTDFITEVLSPTIMNSSDAVNAVDETSGL